jgi:hypothetical protein
MPEADFDPFDLRNLALPPEGLAKVRIVKVPSARPPKDPFIMRVPLCWMERASRLPGQCIAVGLLLWYLTGRTRRKTVTFCLSRGRTLNVSEKATRAALRQLAAAGLVRVVRRPGRGLEVTILEVPPKGIRLLGEEMD